MKEVVMLGDPDGEEWINICCHFSLPSIISFVNAFPDASIDN